jgi:hypothetical protein
MENETLPPAFGGTGLLRTEDAMWACQLKSQTGPASLLVEFTQLIPASDRGRRQMLLSVVYNQEPVDKL